MEPKTIKATKKDILTVDGLEFKDLNGNGQLDKYEDWRLSPEERAEDLISQMTVDEKAGLFVLVDKPMGISVEDKEQTSHEGIISEVNKWNEEREYQEYPTSYILNEQHIRHIIVRENAKASELATWVNTLQEMAEESRLGIPVIIASNSRNENAVAAYNVEDVGPKFTAWPGPLGIAATHDLDVPKELAAVGKKEWQATNIRKGYMYMADVVTDPRWYRIYEAFGEDPTQVGDIVYHLIDGFQGDTLDEESIALTIKHFPGGGARENGYDPHYEEGKYNVYATEDSLAKYHLPAFARTIEANPSSIMPYYAIPSNDKSSTPQAPFDDPFEEIAFAYNRGIVTDLLREKMGFEGYVNSDTGVLGKMAWGAEDYTEPERAQKMLEAGTDIVSGSYEVTPFREAFNEGLVADAVINRALTRTLKEMFTLGLFENPYVDAETADAVVNTAENQALAYRAHQESVVLLKNNEELLPLTSEKLEGKKVYVELFAKAASEKEMEMAAKSGSAATSQEVIDAFPTHFEKDHPEIDFTSDYEEADYALLFLEPSSGSYFEATDDYLELNIFEQTGVDLEKVKAIRDRVPNVVMNVNFDLPFLLTNVEPLADALLAGFDTYASATLDVVLGDHNPSGKLPMTLPGSDEAIAIDENGISASPNDVPGYDKEEHMNGQKYGYVDTDGNEYYYGHGLGY